MNRKQTIIRRIILAAFAVTAVVAFFLFVKIRPKDTDDKNRQTGQYRIEEVPAQQTSQASIDTSKSEISNEETAQTIESGEQKQAAGLYTNMPNSSEAAEINNNTDEQNKDTASQSDNQMNGSAVSETKNSNTDISSGNSESSTGMETSAQEKQPDNKETKTPATENVTEKPEQYMNCTIEIRCDSLSEDISRLDNKELQKYIPADGTILTKTSIRAQKGASVFDVLEQVCSNHNIQLDADYTPMFKNYYIKAIAYFYEKAAGMTSGWKYYVNQQYPKTGCSAYKVSDGDEIVWEYSLTIGQ